MADNFNFNVDDFQKIIMDTSSPAPAAAAVITWQEDRKTKGKKEYYYDEKDNVIFIPPGNNLHFSLENATVTTVLHITLENEDEDHKGDPVQCLHHNFGPPKHGRAQIVPENKETKFCVSYRDHPGKELDAKYVPGLRLCPSRAEVTFPRAQCGQTQELWLSFQCVNSFHDVKGLKVKGNKVLTLRVDDGPALRYSVRVCMSEKRDYHKHITERTPEKGAPDILPPPKKRAKIEPTMIVTTITDQGPGCGTEEGLPFMTTAEEPPSLLPPGEGKKTVGEVEPEGGGLVVTGLTAHQREIIRLTVEAFGGKVSGF